MLNDENIMRLQQAIEEVACRSMRTPKDFDYLSELIKERLHETVSASTLKRFFGYVSSPSLPRQNTLDILSTFVGYKDWEAFCQQTAPSRPTRGGATMSSGIPSETQVPPRGDLEDAPPSGGTGGGLVSLALGRHHDRDVDRGGGGGTAAVRTAHRHARR